EHLGNKLPLEKSLNIKASNGYFDKKKDQYTESKIEVTREFGKSACSDWLPTDIADRDKQISEQLTSLFKKWVTDYESINYTSVKPVPTPEQEEMLRQLRAAGIIP
ncbi:MAG: HNH endonuclease, partial [Bacteroidales bacterium]|nr:HNH endonuclease [Bacteroidales bacterium]